MTGRALYMHHAWLYASHGEFVLAWEDLTDVSQQVWNALARQVSTGTLTTKEERAS